MNQGKGPACPGDYPGQAASTGFGRVGRGRRASARRRCCYGKMTGFPHLVPPRGRKPKLLMAVASLAQMKPPLALVPKMPTRPAGMAGAALVPALGTTLNTLRRNGNVFWLMVRVPVPVVAEKVLTLPRTWLPCRSVTPLPGRLVCDRYTATEYGKILSAESAALKVASVPSFSSIFWIVSFCGTTQLPIAATPMLCRKNDRV